ncbi:MAG: hypothetical protein HWE23_01865 [Rhodobacteraceae bacterium]|nr:hypothetical protein [Paracoccaceae bacterium]
MWFDLRMKRFLPSNLDRILSEFFDRSIDRFYLVSRVDERFHFFFDQQVEHHNKTKADLVFKYMDDIDNKSSAMLAHVSMIIAAASILIQKFDEYQVFLLSEIVIYVFVAIGLLRCMRLVRPADIRDAEYIDVVVGEAGKRLVVYARARLLTLLATIVFCLGILLKLFSS